MGRDGGAAQKEWSKLQPNKYLLSLRHFRRVHPCADGAYARDPRAYTRDSLRISSFACPALSNCWMRALTPALTHGDLPLE